MWSWALSIRGRVTSAGAGAGGPTTVYEQRAGWPNVALPFPYNLVAWPLPLTLGQTHRHIPRDAARGMYPVPLWESKVRYEGTGHGASVVLTGGLLAQERLLCEEAIRFTGNTSPRSIRGETQAYCRGPISAPCLPTTNDDPHHIRSLSY